jgi:hypothetical protein
MNQEPNHEDLRKLHQEVNQIVQQRFFLTTVAIGVFGAIMAWAFPRVSVPSGSTVPVLTYLVCISLLVVLATLFSLHLCLKLYLRVLTAYLVETSGSVWEVHWAAWRKRRNKYVGYTKPQTFVFLGLGLLTVLYPFFIGVGYQLHQDKYWITVTLMAGCIYVAVAALLGLYYGMEGTELVYRARWKEVLEETGKPDPDKASSEPTRDRVS